MEGEGPLFKKGVNGHHSGFSLRKYTFEKNDKYKRDTFSSTVLVRNMAL